jgi:hypothetical protein
VIPADAIPRIAELTKYARTLEVTNENAREASERRAEYRSVCNELERARKADKEPILAQGRTIDACYRQLTDPLLAAQRALEEKLAGHMRAAAEQVVAAAGRQAVLDLDGMIPDMSAQASVVSADASGIKTKQVRRLAVLNENLIPDRFWVLDMVALRQAVLVDGMQVPGVQVVEDTVPA